MGEGRGAEPAGEPRGGWAGASIAVVADDAERHGGLMATLEEAGFAVAITPDADLAADAFIVDFGIGPRSGPAICATIRRQTSAPILVIADRRADDSAVHIAFNVGADHYAPAGSTSRELLARLRALLRRFPPRRRAEPPLCAHGPIVLERESRRALVHGVPVSLSHSELEALETLIERAGRVMTRGELLASGWIDGHDDGSVDFFMRRLRQKLEAVDTRRRIVAIRGVGFRLELDDQRTAGASR